MLFISRTRLYVCIIKEKKERLTQRYISSPYSDIMIASEEGAKQLAVVDLELLMSSNNVMAK
jgi:hypothetical protein